jgi:hypothetical protein
LEENRKLDYSLESAEARNELVKEILAEIPPEELTAKYLNILSDYIISAMDKEEKKEKKILTNNRMITLNKRETSWEALTSKLENGEDGLYNLMAGNDKGIIFSPKVSITEQDLAEIPGLKELKDAISDVTKMAESAKGKRKYQLKKQVQDLCSNQYLIKNTYKTPIYALKKVKNFTPISYNEDISVNNKGEVVCNSTLSLLNKNHIVELLCN